MEKLNEVQTAEWVDCQLSTLLSGKEWTPNTGQGMERLLRRREAVRRRARQNAWIMAGAVAISGGVMAFPGIRAYAHKCVQACVEETARAGQYVLAKLNPGQTPQLIRETDRQQAPDFVLAEADGRAIQLSEFRGQVVVLNFWATWCNPCRVEIPWFIEFQRTYKSQGFSVIGVSFDEDGWNAVRPFISQQGINYPVVIGGDQAAQSFGGVESLPTTLIIDRHGRVAATHPGLVSRSVYENDIQSVLREP